MRIKTKVKLIFLFSLLLVVLSGLYSSLFYFQAMRLHQDLHHYLGRLNKQVGILCADTNKLLFDRSPGCRQQWKESCQNVDSSLITFPYLTEKGELIIKQLSHEQTQLKAIGGKLFDIRQASQPLDTVALSRERDIAAQLQISARKIHDYVIALYTELGLAGNSLDKEVILYNSIIFFLFLILSAYGVHVLSRQILNPITNLHEATRHISNGQFDYRIGVTPKSEIGDLAASFNQMAENINDSTSQLVKQIETRKHAEEELLVFQQFVEASNQGMGIFDLDNNIIFINHSLEKMLGIEDKEAVYKTPIAGFYSEESQDEFNEDVIPTVKSMGVWAGDLILKNNGDIETPTLQCFFLIRSLEGTPSCIACVVTDISEQKEIEKQINEYSQHLEEMVKSRTDELKVANEQITEKLEREKELKQLAEEANRAKSDFIAKVSHEIRTPMNSILGFSELLQKNVTNPEQKQYTSAINTSGKTLLALLNDILDLSKVEAGKLVLDYSTVSVAGVINDMKQIFSSQCYKKGLDFLSQVADAVPEYIMLDDVRIRQVLMNLLSNALKFTEAGFIKLNVQSFDSNKPGFVNLEINVEDSGLGIEKSQQKKIFKAFEQSANQSHAKYGGTGLGLAICKQLITAMNGTLTLKSEPGKGAAFTVSLFNVQIAASAGTEGTGSEVVPLEQLIFEPATIVIVDDDLYNVELLREYVNYYELTVKSVSSCDDIMVINRQQQVHLILIDLNLPDFSGHGILEQVKESEELHEIPIVALTSTALKKDILAQFSSCLVKPISQQNFVAMLMSYLDYEEVDEGIVEMQHVSDVEPEHMPLNKELLSKLLKVLQQDIMPIWQEHAGWSLDMTKNFTLNMIQLANKYQWQKLKNWAENLDFLVRSFELETFAEELEKLPEFIREIKTLLANK